MNLVDPSEVRQPDGAWSVFVDPLSSDGGELWILDRSARKVPRYWVPR